MLLDMRQGCEVPRANGVSLCRGVWPDERRVLCMLRQVLDNGKLKLSRRALQIDEGAVAAEEPPPQPLQLPEAGKVYRRAR